MISNVPPLLFSSPSSPRRRKNVPASRPDPKQGLGQSLGPQHLQARSHFVRTTDMSCSSRSPSCLYLFYVSLLLLPSFPSLYSFLSPLKYVCHQPYEMQLLHAAARHCVAGKSLDYGRKKDASVFFPPSLSILAISLKLRGRNRKATGPLFCL